MRTSQLNENPTPNPSAKKTIWSRRGTGTFIEKTSNPICTKIKSQSILVQADNHL